MIRRRQLICNHIGRFQCIEQSNAEYTAKLKGLEDWEPLIGQYYEGSLWERRNILLMKQCMIACIQASYELQ
jgi:hypothetical protein